jgi:hypothetical protein
MHCRRMIEGRLIAERSSWIKLLGSDSGDGRTALVSIVLSIIFVSSVELAGHPQTRVLVTPQEQTKKLRPRDFRHLPPEIIRYLESRNCLIPQSGSKRNPENVISGSFKLAGQQDWAVLCSRNQTSSILIFWAGSAKSVSEIAAGKQTDGSCRTITAVGRQYILQHYRYYRQSGARKPPPINHQGIDDGNCETVSVVRYLYRGKWLQLQGAD